MREAMSEFRVIATSVTVPIILLFTKKDVFIENLKVQPFSEFFPEYTGMMDSPSICAYIATMFQRLHVRPNGKLYIRFVNATDPDNFKEVFKEIETNMLKPQYVIPKHVVQQYLPWIELQSPHEASSSTTLPFKADSDNDSRFHLDHLHVDTSLSNDDPMPGLAI